MQPADQRKKTKRKPSHCDENSSIGCIGRVGYSARDTRRSYPVCRGGSLWMPFRREYAPFTGVPTSRSTFKGARRNPCARRSLPGPPENSPINHPVYFILFFSLFSFSFCHGKNFGHASESANGFSVGFCSPTVVRRSRTGNSLGLSGGRDWS